MPGSPLDSLKPVAGRALEAALNRALALDPDLQAALAALDGRRVAIAVESPPLALQIGFAGGRLQVGPVPADGEDADLAVRGTLSGLLAQLPFLRNDPRRDQAAPVGRLRVSGDAELARRLQQLAVRFDPDWQQPFVRIFGEVLGVQIAQGLRGALLKLREDGADFARSAVEYVTEESREVVGRAELAAFCDDVDVLRDDVERLAARLVRLGVAA
ncbi:MAG: SCP2 sterol-binding domain-containing protein [Pseudoxanthomonas sp.]